jgi:membrane protease YdiL (CAAX protease family)
LPATWARDKAGEKAVADMSQIVRAFHVVLFIAVWMSLGWLFHLNAYAYLLVGIPLSIAFQKFVCRQPLRSCWVRDSAPIRLDRLTTLITIALLIVPVTDLFRHWPKAAWSLRLYFLACIFGAFGAGFALRHFTKLAAKSLLLCLATAGSFGCALMLLGAFLKQHFRHQLLPLQISHHPALLFGDQFLLLFPVCFVVEEVVFRGVLDSHLHQPQDSDSWLSPKSWLSAAFLSILWGWWHLPILLAHQSASKIMAMFILTPVVTLVPGIAYSLCWRRSGNLAVPATVHALIDAVRNVFLGVPSA